LGGIVACLGASACGGEGPATRAARADVARLKAEIGDTERFISAARSEADGLDAELASLVGALDIAVARLSTGSDQIILDLDAEIVSTLARGFLNGYAGTEEAIAGAAGFQWQLQGIRTRLHRQRVFLSGAYTVRIGEDECTGPVHGHLFYLERNLLKLSDMLIRCTTAGTSAELQIDDRLDPVPLPFRVLESMPLKVREGVRSPVESLDLITPVEVNLGESRVRVRTRSVTLRGGN